MRADQAVDRMTRSSVSQAFRVGTVCAFKVVPCFDWRCPNASTGGPTGRTTDDPMLNQAASKGKFLTVFLSRMGTTMTREFIFTARAWSV